MVTPNVKKQLNEHGSKCGADPNHNGSTRWAKILYDQSQTWNVNNDASRNEERPKTNKMELAVIGKGMARVLSLTGDGKREDW